MQTKILHLLRNQRPHHSLAANLHQERIVTQQHIPRPPSIATHLSKKPLHPRKTLQPVARTHWNASSMSLTSASAKSLPILRTAAPSSCTNPLISCVDWYCSLHANASFLYSTVPSCATSCTFAVTLTR